MCAIFGMFGVGVTSYFSYLAGKKAASTKVPENETKKEKIIRIAKTYGPAVGSGLATAGVIFTGNSIHLEKETALAGLAVVSSISAANSDKELTESKDIEKKSEAKIPVNYNSANGLLIYEPYTDQYIWTSSEALAWTMLEANRVFYAKQDLRVNYIVTKLGGTPKPVGNEYGWNYENELQNDYWGYFDGPWIQMQPELKNEGPYNVLYLYYTVEPEKICPETMNYKEGS